MPYTLCVLGCGTMGIAILSGVLDSTVSGPASQKSLSGSSTPVSSQILEPISDSKPDRFIACVAREESAKKLRRLWRESGHGEAVQTRVDENVRSVEEADVVLLACKPQVAQSVLTASGMAAALEGKLVISILAGTTSSRLRSWMPQSARVVRAMPNTPCKIREGMTVLASLPPSFPDRLHSQAKLISLFDPIGRTRFLDEKHFDACTALSGSGPAFALVVLEAMADGGVMMGLPRKEALELAAQTMQGAARMVIQTGLHPAALKDSVTTPGGCTIAGLLTLEDGRMRSTIARCIETATRHAASLDSGPGQVAAADDASTGRM